MINVQFEDVPGDVIGPVVNDLRGPGIIFFPFSPKNSSEPRIHVFDRAKV
jgi:hypothetical protein